MTQQLKVAIIGAGGMAREHIRAFRDVPGVAVTGIHSRTCAKAEALAAEFGIPAVCDSVDDLYAKTNAALVVVTVTELSMNAIGRACFNHPWAVLLEKPAGYNVKDAEAIRDAAKARGRKVFVALNRRFNSSTRAALERLKGNAGERFIKVQDQQDQAGALAAGQPAEVVKNWMFANSIHMIDLFRVFGRGKVVAVEPVFKWNPEKPGTVVAKLTFESGDKGLYEGIWDGPGPWAVTVNTPAERLELRPLEQASVQIRGERKLTPIEQSAWDKDFKAGFRLQAEMAVNAAQGKPSEVPTLEDSLASMYLVRDIFSL